MPGGRGQVRAADHDTAKPYLTGLLPLVSGVIADLKAPHEVLASIANVMPRESLALAEANVVLSRRVVDTLPPAVPPLIRAWRLENLAPALSDTGRSADALPLIEQAVAIFRSLGAADPERFGFFIPGALGNLGQCLLSVRRLEDALNVDQEALVLFRGLTAADPGHRKNVASSLLNAGACLGELGRPADAFLCTEEALRIHRGLAADPDRYQAGLARCLANFGGRLLNLGHQAEATRLFHEALEVYRSVAAASPGIARSYGLRHSLGTISSSLYQISGPAKSLPAAEESVAICRALAADDPGRRADVARTLLKLALCREKLGISAKLRALPRSRPDLAGTDYG